MDRNRPMADGRDLLESRLQELIREAWGNGYAAHDWWMHPAKCPDDRIKEWNEKLHKILISYLDGEAGDVGAQDEASEARAVGDSVRPEPDLRNLGFKPTVFDEITDEFTKQMSMRFYPEGIKPIGHCKLEKMPDGSVHATIKYH